ncbi:hypothetical protein C8R46DRAFT_6445 [Mycena filopes]|nr:hypothetical protein C8R46DRAFT_6445 [Mycena filopes]
MEERVSKSGLDKAKSENKFFAAMRDKEAIENERKTLARNLEKQGKVVERLVETERNLNAQVASLDRDLAFLRNKWERRADEVAGLKSDAQDLRTQLDGELQRLANCKVLLTDRERELAEKKQELQKITEDLALSKRQVEKQSAKLQERAAGSGSSRELELETELKLTMNVLKCTACKGAEFRDTVLTKCMHTFCRSCVDARLTTRQRKCPACGQAFANADVQTIYLQ